MFTAFPPDPASCATAPLRPGACHHRMWARLHHLAIDGDVHAAVACRQVANEAGVARATVYELLLRRRRQAGITTARRSAWWVRHRAGRVASRLESDREEVRAHGVWSPQREIALDRLAVSELSALTIGVDLGEADGILDPRVPEPDPVQDEPRRPVFDLQAPGVRLLARAATIWAHGLAHGRGDRVPTRDDLHLALAHLWSTPLQDALGLRTFLSAEHWISQHGVVPLAEMVGPGSNAANFPPALPADSLA